MPTALVTGAGIRVGRAIALGLARRGHDVHLCAHASADAVQEVQTEIEALGQRAFIHLRDLSLASEVDALAADVLEETEILDVLVNSAGVFWAKDFANVTREEFRKTHAINLEAPFFLCQALLPALQRATAPLVVNVTDILAERPISKYSHYVTSKAALLSLTRALAVELAPHVRVNAVAPGTVAFPEQMHAEERAAIVRSIPFRREGTPDDLADAVVALLDLRYVSGEVIAVDGARSAHL